MRVERWNRAFDGSARFFAPILGAPLGPDSFRWGFFCALGVEWMAYDRDADRPS
jgi:hypothetical protein